MYVKTELRRFRVVKEVGTIVMSVRIFACYQLMQVCQVRSLFILTENTISDTKHSHIYILYSYIRETI